MTHTITTPGTPDPAPTAPEPTTLVWTSHTTGPARLIIDEWERLASSRIVLRRVNAWPFLPRPVESLDDLLQLAGFGRAIDDAEGDRLLWHLVRHGENDELAARIVLHRVMPSILAMVRRRGRVVAGGANAAMNEAIGAAWMVIRQFPHERRRSKIAANLVRDIEYHAFVRDHRLKRVSEVQVDHDIMRNIAHNPQVDETAERLDDVLCEAMENGVEQRHLMLLRRLGAGESTEKLATESAVSTRTMRNRRRDAIDAVRASMQ